MNKSLLHCGRFQLDLSVPRVMGILNVTPDSFSDGGRYTDVDKALVHVESMLEAGADLIDIGAESTRPGAQLIDAQTELERLLPIIDAIQSRFHCCLSVDTNKPQVMQAVLQRQVDMINDVRGFVADGALASVAASQAAICIMHMQGLPESMQDNPSYHDVINDVGEFLQQRAQAATDSGIDKNRICIDPGFGFGKSVEQNLLLLKHCGDLSADYPVLFGLSRKSTLAAILGDADADRTIASVTGALLAIQQGAKIVRVHDVQATVEAIKVYHAMAAA